jgi:gliding motility-associatede transport system auxiliary component
VINIDKKLRLHFLLHNFLFVILLLVMVGLLGYLALATRLQWDATQNSRNSLSQASIATLQQLAGPVDITVYATDRDMKFGDVRDIIGNFIALYQNIKPDITVTFVDPVAQPKLAQQAGVRVNGEMVISYKGRREHLTVINEQAMTNLFMRLARDEEKMIRVLTGHGERSMSGDANYDLGEFGKQLLDKGFKSSTLNLALEQDVPIEASILIIASPQKDLLPGEVDKLLTYIDRGGNLLWLVDHESLRGLLPLAEQLQLTLTPGVVVDPQAKQLKAPITFTLGVGYGQHAITNNFDYLTVFPFARQITINENKEWYGISLVDAAQQGWVETGDLNDDVSFDQMYDVAGPVSIAAALSRSVRDKEQRVVVVGSGHFLANTYLGNGGNLDFGLNLINWLAGDDQLITIQPRATRDSRLVFSETTLTLIVVSFLIVLPVLLLASGIFIWWYRRRK